MMESDYPRRAVLRHNGKFMNPWPQGQMHSVLDFLKWVLIERSQKPSVPQPSPAVFPRAISAFPTPRAANDALVVTWIGHTSFLIQMGGNNILLDPVWSDRASPVSFIGPKRWNAPGVDFNALPPIDLVIISHDHYDHLDLATVRRIVRTYPNARWAVPLGVGAWLRQQGASICAELDWWQSVEIDGIALTCTPAQHFSGRRPTNRNTTLWSGWVIRTSHGQPRTLFFAGDTAYHSDFSAIAHHLGPFDAAILPIGAYEPRWFMGAVHMDAAQAVEAYRDLTRNTGDHPCTFIASHWGTFRLTDEPMDEPPKLARETWNQAALPSELLWIPRHGETRQIAE